MIAILLADSELSINTAELERVYELDKTQSLPNHKILAMSGHVVDRFQWCNEATHMYKSRVFRCQSNFSFGLCHDSSRMQARENIACQKPAGSRCFLQYAQQRGYPN
jgi:hypothetical protein